MKKAILILTLLILAFSSVSCIYASDVNDTLAASGDEAAIESAQSDVNDEISVSDDSQLIGQDNNEEKLTAGEWYVNASASDDGDGSIDKPYNTFKKALDNVQDGDTVYFAGGVTYTGIFENVCLDIDEQLTLAKYGDGEAIFDAEGQCHIFYFRDNVIIKNLTFLNGKLDSYSYGAAINFVGNAIITGCSFVNNSAYLGGAIYTCGGNNCNVTDSVFMNNHATYSGGAIYISVGGNCSVTDSVFMNNTAVNDSGAISFAYDTTGIVENCNFTDNKVTGINGVGAGAIFFTSNGNVTNCNFIDNKVTIINGYGGAVLFDRFGSVRTVTNCNFANNSATEGGAIFSDQYTTADTCIFKTESDTTNSYVIILSPSLNVDNFTTFYGAGEKLTFNLTTNSSMPVDNGNISISVYYKDNDSWVGNFSCLSGQGWTVDLPVGDYYAIYNTEYAEFKAINRTVTVIPANTLWALNHTINANNNSEINLTNDYYHYDPAYDEAFEYGIVINRTVTINGNGVVIDMAESNIRAFYIREDFVTLKDMTIKNANCSYHGGAIWWNGIDGTVFNCTFINNTAKANGGAISWNSRGGTVSNCTFIKNTARGNGGAIDWYANEGTVSNCTFINNTSNKIGGAVYWFGEKGSLSYSTFINNTAEKEGGAVYWFGESGNLSYCIFLNNTAVDGSAVYGGKYIMAYYCWFGNNASNYENLPLAQAAYCNTPLFLNATANPDTIYVSDTSDIIFNLYLYSSGDITEYDHAPFNNLNLTITAINGVTSNTAKLGEIIKYNAANIGTGSVTATIENVNLTVNIKVDKTSTEIESSPITTVYNGGKYLVATLKDNHGNAIAGAKLTIKLSNGKTFNPVTDENGQVKVSTNALAPNTYTATITFGGDANYKKSVKEVKITVKKATPKITAKNKAFKASVKTKRYTITLKDNTGKAIKKAKVTLKVNGKTYKATTNSKGKATFKITKLNKKGTFKAVITYKGNKYYKKVTKKAKITIKSTFKTVSKGSKDKATVKKIQQALKDNGYYLTYQGRYLMVDGIFESCTERSVKEFQHDNGLKATGKVDEKTAQKLKII